MKTCKQRVLYKSRKATVTGTVIVDLKDVKKGGENKYITRLHQKTPNTVSHWQCRYMWPEAIESLPQVGNSGGMHLS